MSVAVEHEVQVIEMLSELHWLQDVIGETCRTASTHDFDSEALKSGR
jgi:hypothetical protein